MKQQNLTQKKIQEILQLLDQAYPDAECALHHVNIFQLLIAVVLSAQTTDISVNKITPALFAKYPTPEKLAQAEQDEVIEIIKSIGMYKTKSRNIINLSKQLVENFNGKVPEDDELLQTLPGVGRKTANVVMSVGFGYQRIAVDTHVFRVSNRIGLVSEKDVLHTEQALMRVLPQNVWSHTHHLLIFHGRRTCIARSPKCKNCTISQYCNYYKTSNII